MPSLSWFSYWSCSHLLRVQTVKFLSPIILIPSALPCLYQAVFRDFQKYQKVSFLTNYSSVNNTTICLPHSFSGTPEKADANSCTVRDRVDNKPIPRELSCDKPLYSSLYKCTLQRSTRLIHGA